MKNIDSTHEFDQLLEQELLVIADFYADWCPSCMALMPTLETLASRYSDRIQFVKVNVDNDKDLALRYGVRSIPALFFIHNREITDQITGMQTMAQLEERVSKLAYHAG